MSSIMKGLLNEVDPRNFDSDIDYYNALNKPRRGRSEDDYVEPQDDEPIRFQQKPDARPQYDISKDEDRQAGYNMTLTVKAPTTQKAQWAAESYVDSNWGAKKQIGDIEQVADGVVKVHMIDNHKYGMWKPWQDEPPIAEPISFNEGKTTHVSALTEAKIYKLWETAGQKIVEAQLTQDQINQIFQYAEKIQTASGDNRTLIGKGKDAASAINTAWEDLKTKVQNSGPVAGFDQMYDKAAEKLKQATGGDQGAMSYVQKYRDFAKKHPVAQSLIYSALIAAAGISGAGAGGAAALGLFKLVDKLLQGEKFSSAAYSGAKTGAMAYGASKVGDMIKGQMAAKADPGMAYKPDVMTPTAGQGAGQSVDMGGSFVSTAENPGVRRLANWAVKNFDQNTYDYVPKGMDVFVYDKAGNLVQSITSDPSMRKAGIYTGKQMLDVMKKSAGVYESINLSESQITLVISTIVDRQHKLDEGVIDSIKGAAGKAVDWAKTKGTNLTTKVTADKLLQAWKKAGSPTDSLDVAKVVQNAGIPSETIKQVYTNMKIPFAGQAGANSATRKIDVDPSSVAPPNATQTATSQKPETATAEPNSATVPSTPATTKTATVGDKQVQTTYAQVRALIDKLDKRSKQNVVKALKKNLGIALSEAQINELSSDLLANYKKKAGADASAADKKGDYKRGDKRMSGIIKATKKQFANDEKGVAEGWKEEAQDLEDWSKEVNMRLYRAHESQRLGLARQLSNLEQKHFGSEFTHPNLTNVVWSALRALQKGDMVHYDPQRVGQMPFGNIVGDDAKIIAQYNITRDELAGYRMLHDKNMVDNLEQFLKLRRLVRAKSWPLEYFEELEKLTPEEAWLKMANDLNWSKDSMAEEVQAKTDDKLLTYYAQRKAEKEKQQSQSQDQLDEKWSKKYKDSINCSNPKGFSQKAHCAGKQKNESAIMSGLNQLDEGWKEKLGAAALAGSMAFGAGAAHSRVTPDGQGGFTGGLKPTATVTAPSDNKPSAEAPKGFSKEYLQKAADPNRFGRYMISVEKAQELLKSMP